MINSSVKTIVSTSGDTKRTILIETEMTRPMKVSDIEDAVAR